MNQPNSSRERWNEYFSKNLHHNGNPSPSLKYVFEKYRDFLIRKKFLDLGGAQGANSFYTIDNGMASALNIDFSKVALNQCLNIARQKKLENEVAVRCEDLNYLKIGKEFEENFSLVSALFVMHELNEGNWKDLVYKMQNCTIVGGINVITVPKDQVSSKFYLTKIFTDGEIDNLYSNPVLGKWEIDNSFPRNLTPKSLNKQIGWLGGDNLEARVDVLAYRRIE